MQAVHSSSEFPTLERSSLLAYRLSSPDLPIKVPFTSRLSTVRRALETGLRTLRADPDLVLRVSPAYDTLALTVFD